MAENRIDDTEGVQKIRSQSLSRLAAQKLAQYHIAQNVAAAEEFADWADYSGAVNSSVLRNFQQLNKRIRARAKETSRKKVVEGTKKVSAVEKLTEIAEKYQKKNPELQARTLKQLMVRISKKDSVDEIIEKLTTTFVDISLVDEAADFLLETADADMRPILEGVKKKLDLLYHREIAAGKNIGAQSRAFSEKGLGSPTALRDLYREITANPRDAHTLYHELVNKFSFPQMRFILGFLLHSLGADLKASGPSISRADLSRMINETRNMQAILGVYRYFFSRRDLIAKSFNRCGLVPSSIINFEVLAKLFMFFIQDRYPSVDKALILSQQLGIANDLLAQLIIYLQFRDAMRQVSPRLFRDDRQRQEILMCFIETLENLEEEQEKMEKKRKKEEEEKRKNSKDEKK
jgi:type III secretion protein W